MISQAKRLHLRLFLEGQEVPIIAAVVGGGKNMPANASIQVVPTDAAIRLLPRTLVHLFFFDLYPEDAALEALGAAEEKGYQGIPQGLQDVLGDSYKLLFAGELHSYTFQKSPSGRSLTLQCLDFSSYWDSAKQYYAQGEVNSDVAKMASFVGAGNTKLNTEGSEGSATSALLKILNSVPVTMPQMSGLLGGILHLLESIGGVYKGTNRFRGINDFFSAAELRLKLSQTLGASAQDTSSQRLFQHKSFRQWLRQTLARNRGIVSFRTILEILLSRIYHDYASIPAPTYKEKFKTTITKKVPGRRLLPKGVDAGLQKIEKTLNSFGTVYTSQATESTAAYEARKKQEEPAFQKVLDASHDDLIATADAVSTQLDAAKIKKADGVTGEFTYFLKNVRDPEVAAPHARKTLAAIKKMRGHRATVTKTQAVALDRLIMQVFSPNIFFAPPPRCNVIFPDQYTSFAYRRSFMQEVTRLQVKTQKEWDQDSQTEMGGGTKKTYWAPETRDVQGTLMSQSAKKGAMFLLPHEVYTGIIPQMEHESDLVAFQQIDKQHGGRDRLPYMQRFTNYKFFLQRFGPRTATISGPFNPYLAPGFPALVVDRHLPEGDLNPTQYLGTIMSVTHSVDQSGNGTTSVQMAYCRTHDEELEQGTYENLVTEIIGTVSKAVSVTGELSLEITDTDTTVRSLEIVRKRGKIKAPEILRGSMESLTGKSLRGLGKILSVDGVSYVSQQSGTVQQQGDIFLTVQRHLTRQRSVMVPPEKALFPGWMSPIYTNLNIGRAFYMEMFGVGSICDPIQFGATDRGIASQGMPFLPESVSMATANSMAQEKLEEFKRGTLAQLKNVGDAVGLGDASTLTHALASEVSASVQMGMSTHDAVNSLVDTYRALKDGDYDIDDFLGKYTRRPVATMREILGPPNYVPGGIAEQFGVKAEMFGKTSAAGFHTNAFGPYDRMRYLDHPALPRMDGKGERRQVDGSADPRKERYQRVLEYCLSLQDRGLRG